MNTADVGLLLEQDVTPFLSMKAGTGHTLFDIRERVCLKSDQVSQSWIGYVVTTSFDVFFYYGRTHDQFNHDQGLGVHDILLSGYFFPKNTGRGADHFGIAVRGEGIIDLWMRDQHPFTKESREKFLRFKFAIEKSIHGFINSLQGEL